MKTKTRILSAMTLVVLFSFLTGCMPCYYAPNAQNVPVFTEKGDGNGTFSFQFGALSVGMNVQGALAVSNHIGLMGNYNHYSGRNESGTLNGEDYSSKFKSNMGELGMGYYHTFHDKMVFEVYAGIGGSRIDTDYERYDGDGSSSIGTTCYFIQPAIGYYNKHVQLALSTRLRIINFRDVKYDSWLGTDARESIIDLQTYPTVSFFEPAFTVRVGGEKVKFQAQVMGSVPIGYADVVINDPVNINIGIVFCIHEKSKSKQYD
jgi:hypothetical protein